MLNVQLSLQFIIDMKILSFNQNYLCCRCLYPTPPPPEMVTNCSEGGVLGPVPGVIGVLQALEAIKILSESGEVLSGKLLLFDAISSNFRTIRLRNRSENATVDKLIDYEQVLNK